MLAVLSQLLAGYDPVAAIAENEAEHGFKVIRPGDAPWFSASDWRPASVASLDRLRARLVLIHAIEPRSGAFTRTVEAILENGLTPVVVCPTAEFALALKRLGWNGFKHRWPDGDSEDVWTKRRRCSPDA